MAKISAMVSDGNVSINSALRTRQYNASHAQTRRKGHLKRISLDLTGNRAQESQPHPAIIGRGRENHRWPSPRLFVTSLRIKTEPNDIASLSPR